MRLLTTIVTRHRPIDHHHRCFCAHSSKPGVLEDVRAFSFAPLARSDTSLDFDCSNWNHCTFWHLIEGEQQQPVCLLISNLISSSNFWLGLDWSVGSDNLLLRLSSKTLWTPTQSHDFTSRAQDYKCQITLLLWRRLLIGRIVLSIRDIHLYLNDTIAKRGGKLIFVVIGYRLSSRRCTTRTSLGDPR